MKAKITEYTFHAAANIFPLTEGQAFTDLVESIQRNGLREPLVLSLDKKEIIDGRNRYRACRELGIEPTVRQFNEATDGAIILQFVLDSNLHRRHLTPSQRAVIGAESLKVIHAGIEASEKKEAAAVVATGTALKTKKPTKKEAKAKPQKAPTQAEMAKTVGVSKPTLNKAAQLLESNPAAAAKVKAGKVSVDEAKAEGEEKKAEKAKASMTESEHAAWKKRIIQNCGLTFYNAFEQKTILITAGEAAKFWALDDELQTAVAPHIATGWAVLKAVRFATKAIDGQFTIDDIINKAVANHGGFKIQHNGYEIKCKRLHDQKKKS